MPDKLNYTSLFERVGETHEIAEIIIATNPNIE
jgi:recombinational DNA repair protein RecR